MADDTSTTDVTGETETDSTTDISTSDTTSEEENGLPEGAKRALAAARKQAREAERARKALQSEVENYKQRDLTDQQKLEQRATAAEKVAEDATRELSRLRAARAAGLDIEDADLVTGSTEAEMKASAERLFARFGGTRTDFDGGARTPAGKPVDMNDLIRRQRSTR
jgi:molecular chaperone GrpE (heat shock protein)